MSGPAKDEKDYHLAVNVSVSDIAKKEWTMSVEEIEDCWNEIMAKVNNGAIDRAELDTVLRTNPEPFGKICAHMTKRFAPDNIFQGSQPPLYLVRGEVAELLETFLWQYFYEYYIGATEPISDFNKCEDVASVGDYVYHRAEADKVVMLYRLPDDGGSGHAEVSKRVYKKLQRILKDLSYEPTTRTAGRKKYRKLNENEPEDFLMNFGSPAETTGQEFSKGSYIKFTIYPRNFQCPDWTFFINDKNHVK